MVSTPVALAYSEGRSANMTHDEFNLEGALGGQSGPPDADGRSDASVCLSGISRAGATPAAGASGSAEYKAAAQMAQKAEERLELLCAPNRSNCPARAY